MDLPILNTRGDLHPSVLQDRTFRKFRFLEFSIFGFPSLYIFILRKSIYNYFDSTKLDAIRVSLWFASRDFLKLVDWIKLMAGRYAQRRKTSLLLISENQLLIFLLHSVQRHNKQSDEVVSISKFKEMEQVVCLSIWRCDYESNQLYKCDVNIR